MRISLRIYIQFIISLSFHRSRWIKILNYTQQGREFRRSSADFTWNLSHFCFIYLFIKGQRKIDKSMKNSKFLSGTLHFPPFFLLPLHIIYRCCKMSNRLWKRCKTIYSIVRMCILCHERQYCERDHNIPPFSFPAIHLSSIFGGYMFC